MKKKIVRIITVATVLCSMFVCAFASDITPQANNVFLGVTATLRSSSTGVTLQYYVDTSRYNNKLGISTYSIYDQTTNAAPYKKTINQFVSAKTTSNHFDIPGTVKGHQYYLKVTFYADGSTYSTVTNSVYA